MKISYFQLSIFPVCYHCYYLLIKSCKIGLSSQNMQTETHSYTYIVQFPPLILNVITDIISTLSTSKTFNRLIIYDCESQWRVVGEGVEDTIIDHWPLFRAKLLPTEYNSPQHINYQSQPIHWSY